MDARGRSSRRSWWRRRRFGGDIANKRRIKKRGRRLLNEAIPCRTSVSAAMRIVKGACRVYKPRMHRNLKPNTFKSILYFQSIIGWQMIYVASSTELRKSSCMWFGEVYSSCSLTALPSPAWVLFKYVLQRLFLISVQSGAA